MLSSQRLEKNTRHHLLSLDILLEELRQVIAESELSAGESASTSRAVRILQWVSAAGLALGWAAAILISMEIVSKGNSLALALMMVGASATVTLACIGASKTAREWKSVETDTLSAVGMNMARWFDAINKIRNVYTYEQIAFAQGYMSAVAAQARARLSLFVGALDKVGIIPLVASMAVTVAKFSEDGKLPLLWCTAAAVAGVIYLFALRLTDVAFTLERFAFILGHAMPRPETQIKV